ncbi:MAG TPA: glycoside hydrolase family 43 protein [Sunxiuqinia sp.]|nr:glycoside hydrolase family 43 protein [Sunxiuqinia sp.]
MKLFLFIKRLANKYALVSLTLIVVIACHAKAQGPDRKTKNKSFQPGALWYDTDGVPINAHGAGVLYFKGSYYWFGEHKTSGRGGNTALVGIHCYSSTDLYNWKNEGIALRSVEDPNSDIVHGCIMERPKVIYNKKTRKFVMWFHLEIKDRGYDAARTGVAISDNATGPYTYLKSYRVNPGIWPMDASNEMKKGTNNQNLKWWTPKWMEAIKNGLFVRRDFQKGQMSRDMTLFVDDDAKAYLIYSSEDNLTMHIAELTPDYLGFTGRWNRVFPGGHNEAPAVFKQDNKYYLIMSGCTGWDPNAARMAVADSIWGPWQALGNPCVGEHANLTFFSQSTYVLPVIGMNNSFIFMADRWVPRNPIDGRYIWLPINFVDGRPTIRWQEQWDLSYFK